MLASKTEPWMVWLINLLTCYHTMYYYIAFLVKSAFSACKKISGLFGNSEYLVMDIKENMLKELVKMRWL